MRRVLITGAAGFIGSSLTDSLLATGFDSSTGLEGDAVEIIGLDNFDPYYEESIKRGNIEAASENPNFRLIEGDIRDAATVEEIFASTKPDMIVHLAARAGVRPSLENAPLYVDVNLHGTTNLLEACRRHGVDKFVFASSSSVYGARPAEPFSESDNVDFPVSPYAATKKAGELLCYTYHELFKIDMACLRFFTVYGPRQRPEMAIHKFTRQVFDGDTIEVYGDGSAQRDFTFIDDIVTGIRGSMAHCDGYEIYNLGGGDTVEVGDVVRMIEEACGRDAKVEHQPAQLGDVPNTFANVAKAKAQLGYAPQVPIAEGIPKFVDWFRSVYEPKSTH